MVVQNTEIRPTMNSLIRAYHFPKDTISRLMFEGHLSKSEIARRLGVQRWNICDWYSGRSFPEDKSTILGLIEMESQLDTLLNKKGIKDGQS